VTKGILRNRTTGDELHVDDQDAYDSSGKWFYFKVEGDQMRSFLKVDWEFIPEKPSLRDEVRKLPIGTRFRTSVTYSSTPDWYWVKIANETLAYVAPENESVNMIRSVEWAFDVDATGEVEIIK
jgi:hypothetical protein